MRVRGSSLPVFFVLVVCTSLPAADWPTYRGDTSRSGASSESLTLPLSLAWTQDAPAAPQLAWSSGEGRVIEGKLLGHRVKYDDAFHPAIVGGRVYFGSSVDHQMHCVDLQSGQTLWTFFTGGPIRLAPTVQEGRVYFGSDDGHVYCLQADTGAQIWSLRAGPQDDWLLARGELVSRWPVRTGVLLHDGIAYFGAGIFPHEDIYLYAVRAADGSIVWREDNVSDRDAGRNDLSPQGYLLANDDYLFVPSGRSLPATFDRRTGRLLHKRIYSWRSTAGGVVGGTKALLADGQLYCSGPHHFLAIEQSDGDPGFGWFAGRDMAIRDDQAYVATGTMVARLDREAYAVNSRRRHKLELDLVSLSSRVRAEGNPVKAAEAREQLDAAMEELRDIANVGIVWQRKSEDDSALLISGDHLFVGGEGHVDGLRRRHGRGGVDGRDHRGRPRSRRCGRASARQHRHGSHLCVRRWCRDDGRARRRRPVVRVRPRSDRRPQCEIRTGCRRDPRADRHPPGVLSRRGRSTGTAGAGTGEAQCAEDLCRGAGC